MKHQNEKNVADKIDFYKKSSLEDEIEKLLEQMKNFEKNWDSFQTGFEILQKRTTEIAFSENFKHSELTASEKKSVLDEDISLESISRRLMEGKCNPILTYLMMTDSNIIVICGTGISANSGVVDVQITESELQKYNLSHSESVFDLEKCPEPFFKLAKQFFSLKIKPTISHRFLKLLHDKNLLLRVYTENYDGLERTVGIPVEKIVETKGTFNSAHCIDCFTAIPLDYVKDLKPICDHCKGLVKPDIVFHGEQLPRKFKEIYKEDFDKCDLLIVLGTNLDSSLYYFINAVSPKTPRLLINDKKVGPWAEEKKDNYRDVFVKGDCDMIIKRLLKLLNWYEF